MNSERPVTIDWSTPTSVPSPSSTLVQSMTHDVDDFVQRFTGYVDQKELDGIQSLSHDMQMFHEQGNMSELRKTMSTLITQMEIVEWTYIKTINVDQEGPLKQFNQELHAMMNQKRLSRDFHLNTLSGGSRFDYGLFKIQSWFTSQLSWLWVEFVDMRYLMSSVIRYSSFSITVWLIISLIVLYIYQQWFDQYLFVNYILRWVVWCTAMSISSIAKKSWYVTIIWSILLISLWYISYQFITVNFWL